MTSASMVLPARTGEDDRREAVKALIELLALSGRPRQLVAEAIGIGPNNFSLWHNYAERRAGQPCWPSFETAMNLIDWLQPYLSRRGIRVAERQKLALLVQLMAGDKECRPVVGLLKRHSRVNVDREFKRLQRQIDEHRDDLPERFDKEEIKLRQVMGRWEERFDQERESIEAEIIAQRAKADLPPLDSSQLNAAVEERLAADEALSEANQEEARRVGLL